MMVILKVLNDHVQGLEERRVDVQRVPVLGEYVRDGEEWYQVKRVCHLANDGERAAEVYAVPIVDPTREPIRMHAWMEPEPTA